MVVEAFGEKRWREGAKRLANLERDARRRHKIG
jgi:hypothetical protein